MRNSVESAVAKQTIAIPCPKCSKETKKTLAWLKTNSEFVCRGCGETVAPDTTKLFRDLKKANELLEKTFRRLG